MERLHPAQPSRRKFLHNGAILTTMALLGLSTSHSSEAREEFRPEILGFNFSPVQCTHLGIEDILGAFKRALDLEPEYLRLATYPSRPIDETHILLEEAQRRGIPVILAVGGIKYPRWPEFYADPELQKYLEETKPNIIGQDHFTTNKVLSTLKFNLKEFNTYKNITYLQGGNESANNVAVAGGVTEKPSLIKEELSILNEEKKPEQKTMTTFSFSLYHLPFFYDTEKQIMTEYGAIVDSVGFHFYSRVPAPLFGYLTAGETDFKRSEDWLETARGMNKIVWATEVQAEPFERGSAVHIKSRTSPSFNPDRMVDLVVELTRRGYQRQLLWGVEHWLERQNHGYNEWIEGWQKLKAAPLAKAT